MGKNAKPPNACGIHIHSGTSCEAADQVGGHYFDSNLIESDPWKTTVYVAEGDASNELKGTDAIVTGLSSNSILGHVMVVHDSTGGRIACGVIQSTPSVDAAEFTPYPGSNTRFEVAGKVTAFTQGIGAQAGQTLEWALTGVDDRCGEAWHMSKNAKPANACGIHIHSGTSCEAADQVGGHFYDSNLIESDPWKTIEYVAEGDASDELKGTEFISTGLSSDGILG